VALLWLLLWLLQLLQLLQLLGLLQLWLLMQELSFFGDHPIYFLSVQICSK
jgi:hypothetical protein